LIDPRHLAQYHCRAGSRARAAHPARAAAAALLSLTAALGLSGCLFHRTKPLMLPQIAHVPIPLEPLPPPQSPPMIATLPPPDLGPLPEPPPEPTPRRRRPAPLPPPATPPAQVASAPDPAVVAIGALSAGGDVTPQSEQQAKDLIASILKRIAALPARTADDQKTQVRQVKQFLDQAQQALNSGDAEGAKNLATKAKLLMDDIEKK
jgi:hypothetical protein